MQYNEFLKNGKKTYNAILYHAFLNCAILKGRAKNR